METRGVSKNDSDERIEVLIRESQVAYERWRSAQACGGDVRSALREWDLACARLRDASAFHGWLVDANGEVLRFASADEALAGVFVDERGHTYRVDKRPGSA